jgi:hypothetical protein
MMHGEDINSSCSGAFFYFSTAKTCAKKNINKSKNSRSSKRTILDNPEKKEGVITTPSQT